LKQHLNVSCVIYEIRDRPTRLGGAINITCNGLRILDKIGAFKRLEEICAETPDFEMYNATGGEIGTLSIDTKENHGYSTYRIMRTLVHDTILHRLEEEGIPVKMGMCVTQIEETPDRAKVMFEDGTVDTCDLLVGADGIHSAVRRLHVDPTMEPVYTGHSTLYSVINAENLTSPMYFKGNVGVIMFRRGLFANGFCDKKRTTMYWFNTYSVPEKDREGWIAHGKESEAFKAELLKRVEEIKVPLVKEVIEKSPELRFYPVYQVPLEGKWFTERTVLVGDAAHGTFAPTA
jgi:2-polyprenyl-6-methoxyphenol hydroxylase-like FAD-dependent oxidoreductase